MTKKYYVVKKGLQPGIYSTWTECKNNVVGIRGAVYKSFTDYDSAIDFYNDIESNQELDSESLYIFTDGSLKNSINRYAYLIPQLDIEFSMTLENSTNNRNEFIAILESLTLIDTYSYYNCYKKVLIVSDSEYCIKSITEYSKKWFDSKLNIIDPTKKNLDLVKSILEIIAKIPISIEFVKVKSHTNNSDPLSKYNSIVDRLAQTGSL
jgi:viroplasmin and RNaseH domain-containing protein